ncbi:hypothetical protein Q1W73_05885 [Asticcacaulis sp. ZE23SCel15]|uniref:hypothetical protein n=1 Tax=Asticcacaulis sp. ZE23SCel15 TaxID=3059027 RepID=UPI00266041C9|nr:hypothetical protein [Asticcacaulis sp. ZE23SCel15]WKL58514.1 hypothetical protein Q1W73_05885 [Asticcacaulis sp. ZE23SCel15]
MTDKLDEQIAEFALNASFRAGAELIQLLDMARQHCSSKDYETLKSRVANALGEIGEIKHWAFKAHPDLEALVEQRIDKYGRWS